MNQKISNGEVMCIVIYIVAVSFFGIINTNILKISGNASLISFLIGTFIGLIPVFMIMYISKRINTSFFDFLKDKFSIFSYIIIFSLIILTLFLIFIFSFIFLDFVIGQFLTKTSYYFISISLFLFVFYCTKKGLEVISRTIFILFVFSFVIFLFFLITLIPYIDLNNLKPYIDSSNITVNFNITNNIKINIFSYNSTLNSDLNLNKEKIELDFIYSVVNKDDNSLDLTINHNKKDTISRIINHGLNLESKGLFFKVNAVIPRNASGVITSQDNKIILMKDNNSKIEPNLIVDNDNVEASHSAYIGQFKKEDLFYLSTRGLNKDESIKLLSRSFILGNMNISFEERKLILDRLNLYWR